MKSLFFALAAKFDALAKRERWLVAVAVLGGVLLIGWAMIIDPAHSRSLIAGRGIVEQRAQLAALQAQTLALQAPGQTPEVLAGAELDGLKKQLNAVYERYSALGGSLVPPQRMAGLLEELLGSKRSLRLLSLRTLPVVPVLEKKDGSEMPAPQLPASAPAGLFKHGVEVRLEGSYAELTDYLARLENSPQKLLWSSVSLSAQNHPKLVLTLTVYTLSLDRTWLIV
jgi:MSHA biogenesis protein MshJ